MTTWEQDYLDFDKTVIEEIKSAKAIEQLTIENLEDSNYIAVCFSGFIPPQARAVVFVDDVPFLLRTWGYHSYPKNKSPEIASFDIMFNLSNVKNGTILSFRCTHEVQSPAMYWRALEIN